MPAAGSSRILVPFERGWRWPWRTRPSQSDGAGRSRFHGSGGIEFAGHRAYAQGEDPRHVDWGLYSRTGRLFTKQRENEAGHKVCLLCDVSASMEVEGGEKGRLARQLAAALGQTFALAGETCQILEFAEGLHRRSGWVRGRGQLHSLAVPPDSPVPHRRTDWTRSMHELQALDASVSPVVILSDFWGGEEMADALRNLAASGREMLGIQILSPFETSPVPGEITKWKDAETGTTLTLRPDRQLCRDYREALRKRNEFLSSIFHLRGGAFLSMTSALEYREALSLIANRREQFLSR
jgi:uncharacterized protein (DUF58 family)